MCFKPARPSPLSNAGEPQYIGGEGGWSLNPWYNEEEDRLSPPDNTPAPTPVKRDPWDDYDGSKWVCSACGHVHEWERLCHCGDEFLTQCEVCGKLETLEKKENNNG